VSGSLHSVHVSGGLLPADVLSAVLAGTLDGLSSNDYHLAGESPREAAARVWTHLLGVYRRFRGDLDRLPQGDPAVGATRERWLGVLLAELGYGRVPATPAGGIVAGDRQYPVSHLWGETPIHLLGWNVSLEKRTPGVPGAAQRAPHAMVQELLNRSDRHLWAILSNGRLLRLLRDSATLTGQAYVEFDLEAMFDGELFAEFALLYLLVHESRVEVPPGALPAECWLERWRTTAVAQGVRALTLLRAGVQEALETLGTGFLRHPANAGLRDGLRNGAFRVEDFHRALLRVVYRLLFWAVAEDRNALHPKETDPAARERYATHFSSRRLRDLAVRRHGSAHDDLWRAVTLVVDALGRVEGESRLGLVGLGGLFTTTASDVVSDARLGNQPLLAAVRSLSVVRPKGQPRRHVDFRNLGAEELGSVYESLLELVPRCDDTTWTFTLEALAGNDRKTSGSYYTPTDLVDLVLDTALDPVLDAAERQPDPEQALLALTACDPAIGSGHFMVAAARRIATRLAAVRTGEVDPTPTTVQDAMHDVVARCIYGVDVNPMAAELAKVSLWLEAMTPDRPLSFLDHHIKVGNALLGTTPALLRDGIPAGAYKPIIGDDKKIAAAWRKLNESQRGGQSSLFGDAGLGVGNAASRKVAEEIDDRAGSERSLADVAWAALRDGVGERRRRAGASPGGCLVRGVPRSEDLGRGADHARRAAADRGRLCRPRPSRPRRDRRARDAAPAVPLAPGVPGRVRGPRRRAGEHSDRLDGRLLRHARQPAVGAGQDPREGVLRNARRRDRRSQERGGPQEGDRRAGRVEPGPPRGVRRNEARFRSGESVPASQRPVPALRHRRREHLQRLRRALSCHGGADRAHRRRDTDRARDRRDHGGLHGGYPAVAAAGRLLRLRERGEDLPGGPPRVPVRRQQHDRRPGYRAGEGRVLHAVPHGHANPPVRAGGRGAPAAQPEHRDPARVPDPARRRHHPRLLSAPSCLSP
jgi:hypothetical protein